MTEYIIKYTYQDFIGLASVIADNPNSACDILRHDSNFNGHKNQIKIQTITEVPTANKPMLLAEIYEKVIKN